MSTTTILYRDIAPGAIDGAQITATEATPFSDPSMLADDEHYVSQAATLERNVWTLDGTRRIYGGGTEPYWSSVLSGDDCTLDPAPVVTLTLDGTYTSPGITLVFDTSSSGGYCSDVLICWYRSGALLTEKAFSPDRSIYFCQTTVEQFDKVEITLRKTALPACYAKLSQVIIGVTRVFDMPQIRSARVVAQTDLLAQELPASVLEWVLDSSEDVEHLSGKAAVRSPLHGLRPAGGILFDGRRILPVRQQAHGKAHIQPELRGCDRRFGARQLFRRRVQRIFRPTAHIGHCGRTVRGRV